MKHRSVISFVIVAAALFSLPQLSHDLRALKGEVGARLHRELLHAFLNLPAGEPTAAAVPVARPAETLLASCPTERLAAPSTKSAKVESRGRVEGRAAEKTFEQSAMIGDPASDPINNVASVDIEKAAAKAAASLPELKVETEVAMIIPPDSGIDPRSLATARASSDAAREGSQQLRVEAEGLRVAYTDARFETQSPEWQKVTEEAVRKLNGSLPGAYQFRVLRDGAKTKVLKFKCGDCPATAPRLPRAPRPVAAGMPLPSTFAPAEWVSE
jgi:hypothetical protein